MIRIIKITCLSLLVCFAYKPLHAMASTPEQTNRTAELARALTLAPEHAEINEAQQMEWEEFFQEFETQLEEIAKKSPAERQHKLEVFARFVAIVNAQGADAPRIEAEQRARWGKIKIGLAHLIHQSRIADSTSTASQAGPEQRPERELALADALAKTAGSNTEEMH